MSGATMIEKYEVYLKNENGNDFFIEETLNNPKTYKAKKRASGWKRKDIKQLLFVRKGCNNGKEARE